VDKKESVLPMGRKGRHAREKRNRGEREVEFSQGLMRKLENCRDLFVK
jgi:ribonuclease PH